MKQLLNAATAARSSAITAISAASEAKENFCNELFSFADKDNDTMAGCSAASVVANQHLANMSRLPAVEAHSNLQTPAQIAPH